MRRVIYTIWGPSQTITDHGEGIVFVSTAGHGGFVLDETHAARIYELFPEFHTFAGHRLSFEEDEDCAVVILAYPERFTDQDLRAAVRTVEHCVKPFSNFNSHLKWLPVAAWLNSDAGADIRRRAQAFNESIADKWERDGCSSMVPDGYSPHCWVTRFRRNRDGASKAVVTVGYATEQFYTDEELAAITAVRVAPVKAQLQRNSPFPEHTFVGNGCDFEQSDADPGL